MKKFSKLYESKDAHKGLLDKIGSSSDEVRDICSDLIDEGYKLSIETIYIGLNGKIYYQEGESSKYYPTLSIRLYKEREHDDSGGTTEGDVRNWDGGIYYEGNINILKMIYETCYRFESSFTNQNTNVYYCVRGINDVIIRVTFDVVESKMPIDFSVIDDYLSNDGLELNDPYYRLTDSSYSDNRKRYIRFEMKGDTWNETYRESVKRMISSNTVLSNAVENDDSEYLGQLVDSYVNRIFDVAKSTSKSKLSLKKKTGGHNYDSYYTISLGDTRLISFTVDFPIEDEVNITVAKGIFKNKVAKVSIRSVDIRLELHY